MKQHALNYTKILLPFCILLMSVMTNAQPQSLIPPQPSVLAGEMPVTYDVSASGGFTFLVPLDIPPGINELIPNLAITYNSQGGNGLLGIGWSLQGLSAISRSSSTIFHNNELDAVDFDNNDVLTLDGQKLILVGGNTYMTEIKNFAKITSSGTAGTGPESFTVEYPNGLTYEYGNNSQSRFKLQGKQEVYTWAINRIIDKNGNYIDFGYHNNSSDGTFRLTSITYTGNSITPVSTNSIEFTYFTRYNDINKFWINGVVTQETQVLMNIIVKHNDASEALYYRFDYDHDFYTHLTEIVEIRPGTKALPPIKIKWGANATDTSFSCNLESYSGTGNNFRYTMGDFNADGATDFARLPLDTSISALEIFKSNKDDGFYFNATCSVNFAGLKYIPLQHKGDKWSRMALDYNGDGYDDLVLVESYQHPTQFYYGLRMHLYYAIPSGGFTYQGLIFDYSNSSSVVGDDYLKEIKVLPGDFDGDGKRDFLVLVPYELTNYDEGKKFHCFLVGHGYPGGAQMNNLGSYGAITAGGHHRYVKKIDHEIYATVPMEYDGDGKTDLLITYNSPISLDCEIYTVKTNYANGFVTDPDSLQFIYTDYFPTHRTRIQLIQPNGNYYYNIHAGDFNGDGKDDLLTWEPTDLNTIGSTGTWEIRYSKGKLGITGGWDLASNTVLPLQSGELFNTGPWFRYNWGYHVADFNGDGKDDIVQLQDAASVYCENCGGPGTNNIYQIYYSSGVNFNKAGGDLPNNFSIVDYSHYLGDFNGDGQVDILCDNIWSTTPTLVYFRKNDKRHFVSAIEYSGKRIDVSYKSLAEKDAPYYYLPWSVNGHTQREYPYISKNVAIKVVTAMEDNISTKRTYEYQTLSMHLTGLGMQGFHETRITDLSDNVRPKLIKNQYSLFPKLWGTQGDYSRVPVLCTTTVFVQNDMMAWEASSEKRYSYVDEDGGAGGKVRLFMNYGTIEINHAAGSYTDEHKNFYPYNSGTVTYEFGQPTYIETGKGVRNGYIYDRSTFTYDMNGLFFNRAKPVSILRQVTYPGKPAFSRTSQFQYNSTGLLVKKILDPGTNNETINDYQYDGFGNLTSDVLTAPNASPALPAITKNWDYTTDYRFVKRSREYHLSDTYNDENVAINNWGKVTEYKDRTGLVTKYEYDTVNRLVKTELPNGVIERKAYKWAYSNATENPPSAFSDYKIITANLGAAQMVVETSTDGISGATYEFFDFYKRKLRDAYPGFDGQMIYTDILYNNSGVVESSISPYPAADPSLGVTKNNSYDYFLRDHGFNTSAGTSLNIDYQATTGPSKLIATANTSGGRSRTTYSDAAGLYKTEDNGTPIETFYNSNGQPNEVVVNNDQTLKTSYQYDNYGKVVSKTEPNSGTTTYVYNAYSQVKSETYNGITYEFTYDVLGRVTEKKQAGQPTGYTYTYYNTANQASTGKLMLETSPYGTSKQYYYDTLGRLDSLQETVPGHTTFVTKYTYDSKSRIDTRTYPSGHIIQNSYNNYGYLESVDLIAGATYNHRLWQAVSKDHMGHITQAQYYDRMNAPLYTIDKAYHPLGFENSRSVAHVNSSILSYFQTNFDIHTGNLQDRTDKYNHSENFSYDTHDRLTDVGGFGVSVHLQYGDEGNILKKDNTTTSMHEWKYDGYALIQVPEPQNSMPNWILPQPDQIVTYFPFKKVKDISEQNYKVAFIYGPDNQRGKARYFDITNPSVPVLLQEKYYAAGYEKTKNIITGDEEELCYVSAGGELIAILKKEINTSGSTDGVYYIATDHLGSITEVMDDEGVNNSGLLEERSYDAWGRPRDIMNFMPQQPNVPPTWMFDRGYTGHEYIWLKGQFDFGIINMNGRLYDPALGRMFSPDPVLADGTISDCYNKYAYANNNPLKYTDPSGNVIPLILFAGLMSGAINLASNAGSINSFEDGLFTFTIGFGAGAAGAGLGGAVGGLVKTSTFLGGAAIGAAGGVAGGFISSTGNGWMSGQSFNDGLTSGLKGAAIGGISGAVLGGLTTGLNNIDGGMNFWNGKDGWDPNLGLANNSSTNADQSNSNYFGQQVYRAEPNGIGIQIEIHYNNLGNYQDLNWIQTVETDFLTSSHNSSPFLDCYKSSCPVYNTARDVQNYVNYGHRTVFHDQPSRDFSRSNYYWRAELSLVGRNGNGPWNRILSYKYGYTYNNGVITLDPLVKVKASQLSKFHKSWIK
jgi:RHS repeat-associated protein